MKYGRELVAFVAAIAASLALAVPAGAQTEQEGLVNVNLQNIDVGVPVAVAANICDVNVNVLTEYIGTGDTACTAEAESGAVFGPGNNQGGAQQNGLVNVNVSDVVVKVPISVAANICDLDVNVLAQSRERGQTTCDAVAESQA
jgi:hypothetical protein